MKSTLGFKWVIFIFQGWHRRDMLCVFGPLRIATWTPGKIFITGPVSPLTVERVRSLPLMMVPPHTPHQGGGGVVAGQCTKSPFYIFNAFIVYIGNFLSASSALGLSWSSHFIFPLISHKRNTFSCLFWQTWSLGSLSPPSAWFSHLLACQLVWRANCPPHEAGA